MSSFTTLAWIVAILIPGVGQFLSGRYGQGLGLFLLVQVFLNGMLYGLLGFPAEAGYSSAVGRHVFWACLLCLAIVWCYSAAGLLHEAWGRSRHQEEKDAWFREGLRHYLLGVDAPDEIEAARQAFARLVRWDPEDADAHFHLAMCYGALGRTGDDPPKRRKQARRALRRCQRVDEDEKWAWEVRQELNRLREEQHPPSAT